MYVGKGEWGVGRELIPKWILFSTTSCTCIPQVQWYLIVLHKWTNTVKGNMKVACWWNKWPWRHFCIICILEMNLFHLSLSLACTSNCYWRKCCCQKKKKKMLLSSILNCLHFVIMRTIKYIMFFFLSWLLGNP